jgi:4-alpha-glucanotransferase
MKLSFRLRYRTKFGQSLFLTGDHDILGSGQIETAVPLQYLNPECWEATIQLPGNAAPDAEIIYNYISRNADGSVIQDWGRDRRINPAQFEQDEVLILDSWNDAGTCENVFYTEPFKQVLLKANLTEVRSPAPPAATHTFKVKAPLLAKGQTLCLLGETPALGNWSTAAPILLNRLAGEDFLSVQVNLRKQGFPIAYKYGVFDVETKTFICYAKGDNRLLSEGVVPNRQVIVNDGFAALPADTWRGAGVAIPVFSLRSEKSFGVGEFLDLKPLADWCRQVGLKLIQILPVNDTIATHSWMDSYPYAAISAFALHPLYLNLSRVAAGENEALLAKLEPERKRLNALDALDYEAVLKAKLSFILQIYASQKQKTFTSREYQDFFERNKHWLAPYAAFCYLRDKFGTSDFNQWPVHRTFRTEEIARLSAENSPVHDEVALHYFIQFHLHLQLKEAAEHAHASGVIVKGDIPIGVYRHGADAWQHPELFHLDVQAGAPPDAFAAKGQNWGFPTYNWPRMKQDGFAWWKRRFEQMSGYFDAFRIDHILGFFRIWSIPSHAVEGILGYFVPAIPVELHEFSQRGISFDRDRFTKPHITEPVLRTVFGNGREEVKQKFLAPDHKGNFSLKPQFTTQRQVEQHFAALEQNAYNENIKIGLYDLISNVILFEAEGSQGKQFHFRLAIADTLSFQNLDPQTQARLQDLYLDYFYRRQDEFWKQEAMQKLPALKRVTNMLVCGEDLGMVPDCVPGVMKQLGLLSLEIHRMPKRPGVEFSRPDDAPYLSVVTPSTHDMSTIRGWWEEDRALTQKFYNHELHQPGQAPLRCDAGINRAIVCRHLDSPAMWSIFQLQDLLGMDEHLRRDDPSAERINVPANPENYWRYRMHLTLENLQEAETFNHELAELVKMSGR